MKQIYRLVFLLFCLSTACWAQPRPECAVEPLLKTIRVQSAPFNNSCPYYNYGDSVSSERCLVGCVATAIEQLLSHYCYPECLQDSIAGWETKNYALPTVPAGSVVDWDNVADLSLWCGMMVRMNYGVDASASGMWKAEEPLRRVFGYKTVRILDRSLYSFDSWHRILQNELMCGRPVAYVGYSNYMRGHAFNIDGVNEEGLYHCNWGEGEQQNGYFSLEHLCQLQPHWDATDWGRMAGYNANEYMLVLHPDSVEDFLELDTLEDFAHSVRVEDISFRREINSFEYVLTDVTLTNLTDDTLFQTFELILNTPTDTAALEQCNEMSISAVKLMPRQTKTQAVACHYPVKKGEYVVGLTFDGIDVAFSKNVMAGMAYSDDLRVRDISVEITRDSTASIVVSTQNKATNGASGRLVYFRLYKEKCDTTCSIDYRVLSLPAGESVVDTVAFHRLEPSTEYTLCIGGWSTDLHVVKFRTPSEFTGIHTALVEEGRRNSDGLTYNLNGTVARDLKQGVYIKKGRKVIYDSRGDN